MAKKLVHIPLKELMLIIVLFIVLLLISTAFLVWKDIQHAENKFNQQSRLLYNDLSKNISDINDVLNGFVALYNAVGVVDPDQFSYYAKEMLHGYRAIDTIKILTRVDQAFRQEYTDMMSEEGFPAFEIQEGERGKPRQWKPSLNKSTYYPVTAIEPLTPEKIIEIGYDAYSLPAFRKAIDTAINTGEVSAVSDINITNGNRGYTAFKPIYAGRIIPDSEEEKKSQALYLVSVFIELQNLLTSKNISSGVNASLYHKDKLTGIYNKLLNRQAADIKTPTAFQFTEFKYNRPVDNQGQSLMLSVSKVIGFEVIRSRVILVAILIWGGFAFLILYIINSNYIQRMEREASLTAWQWEKERADVTLHSLADAVITTNLEGVVDYMNPVAEKLTGWTSYHAVGRGIEDVFKLIDEANEKPQPCPVAECIRRGVLKHSDADISLINRRGEMLSIDYSIAPMYDQNKNVIGGVLVFQDVGSSRMMSKLLSYQATHDDLTGLYNRREFERRMSRSIERIFRYKEHYVLLYMDLDQFKVVNDRCGHVGGDLVLRQISELVTPLIKERETFARLGGDEFGVLLEGYTLEEAKSVAKEILDAIRKYRFHWSGKIFEIGVSIGIVDIDSGMQSISNIMGHADAACYMAKDLGGNNSQVYQVDDADYKQRKDQMRWVQRITQAFADSRFILFAQKIVSLHKESEEHYEILMRMLGDNGELLVPQEYIIAAERYGSMQDIDRWVIRNAFIHISQYVHNRENDPNLPLRHYAINLSGHTLSSNSMIDYVKEQFKEFPGAINHVIFEITETVAISNLASAQHFISEFKSMGVRFSLDDFGTGVSSFNYLKNLKVDYLKIDGGFVREMMIDPVDYAMVKSISHIGHVMGIKTIAEHAETREVCDNLREIGVDYAQGFYLHEPEKLDNLILGITDKSEAV